MSQPLSQPVGAASLQTPPGRPTLPPWAVYPLPHLHGVAVAVTLRGGPRHEGPDEQGRTHFLEHMIFRGAGPHASLRELMGAFERVGAEPEAYTSEDAITLILELDPAALEPGIELLADVLLRPAMRELESERAVILEERLERVDESGAPCDLEDISLALAFPGHPAGRSILGRRRDIESVSREDLEAWRQRIVGRTNLSIALAGPIDAARAEAALAPLLALAPGQPLEPGPELPDPPGPRYAFHRAEGPQTQLRCSFRAPGEADPEFPALRVLVDLLDGGPTSRLPTELVDNGLCYSGRADLIAFPDGSLVTIEVGTAHAKVGKVLEAIRAICAGLTSAVEPAELERAALRRGHDARRLQDDARALAEWAARRVLWGLPADAEAARREEAAVTPAQLCALAARVLHPERLSVAAQAPEGRARKAIRRAVDAWKLAAAPRGGRG